MEDDENRIIASLPDGDRSRLLKRCTLMELPAGLVFSPRQANHVYFPTSAVITVMTARQQQHGLQVGMIGREGVFGVPFSSTRAAGRVRASVQIAGWAWGIVPQALREELDQSDMLRRQLACYLGIVIEQLHTSSICLKFHTIDERLSKWLLMSQDRGSDNELMVTQALLAQMLGVRRVGISAAAAQLRLGGLIKYSRGRLSILSRKKLIAMVCACYEQDLAIYAEGMRACNC